VLDHKKGCGVPSFERLKHVNKGLGPVRCISRQYQRYVGLVPQKPRPVMILAEDIELLKEQFHLHFGSNWAEMTKTTQKSTFAARIVQERDTGTAKFLKQWDALPEWVAEVVSKGSLHNSVCEETPEETEDDGGAEAHDAAAEDGAAAPTPKSIENAVKSWERAHEAKEGKLSDANRAICRELMTSCFDRVVVLHEKRVAATLVASEQQLERDAIEVAKGKEKAAAAEAAQAEYSTIDFSAKSVHGERVDKTTKSRQFLIHWKRCSASERTWEPEANCTGSERLIKEFRERSKVAQDRVNKRKLG
jgi:hypothetical protein